MQEHRDLTLDYGERGDQEHHAAQDSRDSVDDFHRLFRAEPTECDQGSAERYSGVGEHHEVKEYLSRDQQRKQHILSRLSRSLQPAEGVDMQQQQREDQRGGDPLDDRTPILLSIQTRSRSVGQEEHRAHPKHGMQTGQHRERDRERLGQQGIIVEGQGGKGGAADMQQHRDTRQQR